MPGLVAGDGARLHTDEVEAKCIERLQSTLGDTWFGASACGRCVVVKLGAPSAASMGGVAKEECSCQAFESDG